MISARSPCNARAQHTTDIAHLGAVSDRGSTESPDATGSSIDQAALDLVRSRRDLDLEGHSLCWVRAAHTVDRASTSLLEHG